MSDAQLADRIKKAGRNTSCETILPLVREAVRRKPGNAAIADFARRQELRCAIDRGEWKQALTQIDAFLPDENPFTPTVTFHIAALAENGPRILTAIDAIAGAADRKDIGGINPEIFWIGARAVRKAGLTERWNTLASRIERADLIEAFPEELRAGLAKDAMEADIAAGDLSRVAGQLELIDNTSYFPGMLVARTYAPAWPLIEAAAGEHLVAAGRRYVDSTGTRFAENPDDDVFKDWMHALYFDGQFERVITEIEKRIGTAPAPESLVEDEGWALNLKAYSYDALGRTGDGDAIFDLLAKVAPERNPWVVNFVINRASRLTGQARWKEGLKATELARRVAEKAGSTYAKMLIARDRACVFANLGQAGKAADELAFLREKAEDSRGVAVQGLLCAGQVDEAAAMVMAALQDSKARDSMIAALQPEEFDLFYTRSILPGPRDLIARPEIAAELAKHARILPERFYPAASLKRQIKR